LHARAGGMPVKATPLPTELAGRIPELDGLRGIAILLVLMFHYCQNILNPQAGLVPRFLDASLRLTWSGVDLFFVLSGFLIGGILIDARESSNYFRVFYTRRFFRIVPVYALFLIVFSILAFAVPRIAHGNFSMLFRYPMPWYSYATFTQNIWTAIRREMGPGGLSITWSLAVEEQFYLALPLVVRFFPGRKLVTLLLLGICAAPLLRTAILHTFADSTLAAYVLMPCRADALLLGVLAAVLLRDAAWKERIAKAKLFFAVAFPMLLLGLLYFTKSASWISSPILDTVGLTWIACFYVCILLFALTRPAGWLSRILRNSSLGWLGTIAYGVYLFHQTVLGLIYGFRGGFVFNAGQAGDVFPILAALALTIVIARVSWVYFERPLVQLGHRLKYEGARGAGLLVPGGTPEVASR
jgi:peptidoglycan/LPS O-acetylase OafA/YrhL